MKITWSPKAVEDFDKILAYIKQKWGRNETEAFLNKTIRVLNIIEQHPRIFIESSKKKNVRKAIISKQISLFYLVKARKREIILLTFWDNRQNPARSTF